jgi:acetyl-CoA carboxylase biotin carboxyl carrier protein
LVSNGYSLRNRKQRRKLLKFPAAVSRRQSIMATPVNVPMVGKIVSISVKVGDRVEENDEIAVLEAMKMEMPVVAPSSGVVKEICISAGQEVEAETPIAIVD